MMKSLVLWISLAVIGSSAAYAADPPPGPLDVEGAVRLALRQNYVYRRAQAGVGIAEGNRLDVRVDLRPLLRPVGADLLMAVGEAAFERLRPSHIGCHDGEGGVNVSRIEGGIRRAEQFDVWRRLVRHKDPRVMHSCRTTRFTGRRELAAFGDYAGAGAAPSL